MNKVTNADTWAVFVYFSISPIFPASPSRIRNQDWDGMRPPLDCRENSVLHPRMLLILWCACFLRFRAGENKPEQIVKELGVEWSHEVCSTTVDIKFCSLSGVGEVSSWWRTLLYAAVRSELNVDCRVWRGESDEDSTKRSCTMKRVPVKLRGFVIYANF